MNRRGLVMAGVALAVVLGGGALVAFDSEVRHLLPGEPDCVVLSGGKEIGLSSEQAVAASRAVAPVVRRGGTLARARSALSMVDTDVRRPLAAALTGRSRAALSCTYSADAPAVSTRLTASGLVARAVTVRRELDQRFGRLPVGGFAPGGVTTGHMPGSAHYEGRAVDVLVRPVDAAHKQHGWAIAQYLVANAHRLDLATVIFDGHIWTTRRSFQGWRDYSPDVSGRPKATAQILEHREHVHVDVEE